MQEDEDDDDEMKGYADDVAMPGQKFESKQRITVRNLRIREDTAKVGKLTPVLGRFVDICHTLEHCEMFKTAFDYATAQSGARLI